MTETQAQQCVIKWSQQPSIRQKWPCLKLLHHIPNERQCSPAQGAQLKRMGVRRGVPDLDLPVPRGKYHGLRIEMKDEDGRPTPDQDWWLGELREQGYFTECCHGWESAIRVLEWYLNLGEFQWNR
ncbi:MAG: VRR-NUC domain-containing protein [bacterium]